MHRQNENKYRIFLHAVQNEAQTPKKPMSHAT